MKNGQTYFFDKKILLYFAGKKKIGGAKKTAS